MILRWIRHTDGLLALVTARPPCRRCLRLGGPSRFSSTSSPNIPNGPPNPPTPTTVARQQAIPQNKQSLKKRRRKSKSPKPDDGPPVWPLLRRNSLVGRYRFSNRPIRRPPRTSTSQATGMHMKNRLQFQHSSSANRLMLIVDGLSPNLLPSDFYRLGPSGLLSWGAVIKKVQQRRDPVTLEAQGQYWISFDSAAAAVAYRAKLVRLHELSLLKLRSPSGLWESSVPAQLQTSLVPSSSGFSVDSAAQLNRLVDSYTVAPPSLLPIHFQRRRVSIYHPWDQRLAGLVTPMGFGARPCVVLVDVYPPMLTAENLFDFIRVDGKARGMKWQVAMPRRMQPVSADARSRLVSSDGKGKGDEAEQEKEEKEKEATRAAFRRKDWVREEMLRGRFVVACVNETEAQRFHRAWNGRNLTSSRGEARYVAHTSVIRW